MLYPRALSSRVCLVSLCVWMEMEIGEVTTNETKDKDDVDGEIMRQLLTLLAVRVSALLFASSTTNISRKHFN